MAHDPRPNTGTHDSTAEAGASASPPRDPGRFASTLLQNWITLWQSELTALATDREAQENWQAAVSSMAQAMQALAPVIQAAATRPPGPADDHAAGHTGSPAAPGPTTAHVASDARGDELERLARRVAELERRLAEPRVQPAEPRKQVDKRARKPHPGR